MDHESQLAHSILKDSEKQKEARKVMGSGPPIKFITEGDPATATLLVNPCCVILPCGKCGVVSEVRAHDAYETSVFAPTECHVTKFLLEEWLHEALLKMEKYTSNDAQLHAQLAQDLFVAACGAVEEAPKGCEALIGECKLNKKSRITIYIVATGGKG